MTLKEFMDRNPELMEKAAECKDEESFKKFAEKNGVEIPKEELSQSFAYVRSYYGEGEMDGDSLEQVAGGKKELKEIDASKILQGKDGKWYLKRR